MEPIISVRGLGKRYNITQRQAGYLTLRDSLTHFFRQPFSFVGKKIKDASKKKREDFWALKDINFEVQRGEVLGIIGHNGAGKSTLLKILSQITPPTTGEIRLRGRIGSLLEVGTGFHPELTGRENIFLNAAILGMQRKEIEAKFDQIVDFSEIERFLDTPVKYYSSGMYVRLAFSVAAHLDPDILVLDEVLAVGDSAFQKKCFKKIQEITQTEGRTILFVSHNMNALAELCDRVILLEKGHLKMDGLAKEVVSTYLEQREKQVVYQQPDSLPLEAYVTTCTTIDTAGSFKNTFVDDEPITLKLSIRTNKKTGVYIGVALLNHQKQRVFVSEKTVEQLAQTKSHTLDLQLTLPKGVLAPGSYSFQVAIQPPFPEKGSYDFIEDVAFFEISAMGTRFERKTYDIGVIAPDGAWEVQIA